MDMTTSQETTAMAPATVSPEMLEQVVMAGDLSGLTAAQRLAYYQALCQSLGLNPLSKPFEYLTLNGKLRLYALRDCADQLRRLRGISIVITSRERLGELYLVTARDRPPWTHRREPGGRRTRQLQRRCARQCVDEDRDQGQAAGDAEPGRAGVAG